MLAVIRGRRGTNVYKIATTKSRVGLTVPNQVHERKAEHTDATPTAPTRFWSAVRNSTYVARIEANGSTQELGGLSLVVYCGWTQRTDVTSYGVDANGFNNA